MFGNRLNFSPSIVNSLLDDKFKTDIIDQLIQKQKENEAVRQTNQAQSNEDNPTLNQAIQTALAPTPKTEQPRPVSEDDDVMAKIKEIASRQRPNNEDEFIKGISDAAGQKDILSSIGTGLASTLKYLNTPTGMKLLSGTMSPQAGSFLAQKAENQEAESLKNEQALNELKTKALIEYAINEPKNRREQQKAELLEKTSGLSERKFDLQQKQFEEQIRKNEADLALQNRRLDLESQKIAAMLEKANQSKVIPASILTNIGDTKASINQLDSLKKSADTIKGLSFNPSDKLKVIDPWNTDVQSFNQLVASTKQVIGKGLEGGVLRKEDEEKYEKIIPKLGDTKDVLNAKYQQLRALLQSRLRSHVDTLKEGGYSTSGLETSKELTSTPITNTNMQSGWDASKEKRLQELKAKKAGK